MKGKMSLEVILGGCLSAQGSSGGSSGPCNHSTVPSNQGKRPLSQGGSGSIQEQVCNKVV